MVTFTHPPLYLRRVPGTLWAPHVGWALRRRDNYYVPVMHRATIQRSDDRSPVTVRTTLKLHTSIHAHTHTHTHTYIHTYTHTHTHTSAHTGMHIHTLKLQHTTYLNNTGGHNLACANHCCASRTLPAKKNI